jgi:hypothetical protein
LGQDLWGNYLETAQRSQLIAQQMIDPGDLVFSKNTAMLSYLQTCGTLKILSLVYPSKLAPANARVHAKVWSEWTIFVFDRIVLIGLFNPNNVWQRLKFSGIDNFNV